MRLARKRKEHLSAIFEAIEAEDFEMAAGLCVERFVNRGPYWLYAARIGTELLLRLGRHEQAKKMFEAVIAARALPWAKLGVARAQIEGGQNAQAAATLQGLIEEDESFADAYDVLGRAQIEQGQFEAALETYRLTVSLTPDSLVRVQKLGLMSYYLGERAAARSALSRAVQLGIDSKLFDYQSLVLFAFSCFDEGDTKGLDRCRADFGRALERHSDSLRIKRFVRVTAALQSIAQRKFSDAVDAVRDMARDIGGTHRNAGHHLDHAGRGRGLDAKDWYALRSHTGSGPVAWKRLRLAYCVCRTTACLPAGHQPIGRAGRCPKPQGRRRRVGGNAAGPRRNQPQYQAARTGPTGAHAPQCTH